MAGRSGDRLERAGVQPLDEADLLRRLGRGEREALQRVAAEHGPRLVRLAHRLLGWNGDAADVVQDVLVKLLARPARAAAARNLEAWLTTVTLNECRSVRRRLAARWRVIRGATGAAFDSSADGRAVADETSARVRAAVAALNPRDREVIVLHYLQETDVAEIAEVLGLSRNAVEVRLHRARGRLREKLGDAGGE